MPIEGYWRSVCFGNYLGRFVSLNFGEEYGLCCDIDNTSAPESWYFFSNSEKNSINHHFIFPSYRGDMYFTTNSDTYPIDLGTVYYYLNNGAEARYIGAGLYRITMPEEKMFWDTSISPNIYNYKWEIKALGDNPLPTLYAGTTLPINITLFYGADGSTTHAYHWQTDSDGQITTLDPTEAVKKVTKDACAKLKNDWGTDLRVYLIKYRKQSKYLHKITKSQIDFDYSYLNDCATEVTEPYIYENITNQSELNAALTNIYNNIKTWAERSDAKNVMN